MIQIEIYRKTTNFKILAKNLLICGKCARDGRADGRTGVGTGGLFNRFGTTEASTLKRKKRSFDELASGLAGHIRKRWEADRNNVFWSDLAVRCRVAGAHRLARGRVAGR